MKQGWLIFLLICTVAAAMVPRMRRSRPEGEASSRPNAGSSPAPHICAPTTPCGWSIYRINSNHIEMNITNTYCECSKNTSCRVYEDDTAAFTLVRRCMTGDS